MMHGAVCLEVEMESPSWNLVSSSPSFPGKLTGGWVSRPSHRGCVDAQDVRRMPISDLDGVHGRTLLSSLDQFTVSTDLPASLSLPYTHVRLVR
jgi:hypothetical protein